MTNYKTVNEMIKGQAWERPSYYAGPDYVDSISIGIGRSRDSELDEESNFDKALSLLEGESKHVKVIKDSHWACGWIEHIRVSNKSKKHLKIALKIMQDLNQYPLLDEEDYYDRQHKYQSDYAEEAKTRLAEAFKVHFDLPDSIVKHSDFLEVCYQMNIERQAYAGNDACINFYDHIEPDEYDIEDLQQSLRDISYNSNTSETEAYKLICALFNVEIKELESKE